MKNILEKGKGVLTRPQSSVLSAAGVIMAMIAASAVLGVIRERVLLHYFIPADFSMFKAAFRFPDMFTGVLALGALSSAFIPVFTKTYKHGSKEAWDVAARVVNIGILIFLGIAFLFWIFSENIYSVITPGYSLEEKRKVAELARWLFLSQGFFVVSYTLTGVLESARRFLISALAPIFYNLGIIAGTLLLSNSMGLYAPVIGVLFGAFMHLAIQFPIAYRLGFRFSLNFTPNDGVKRIAKLAAPRMFELVVLQLSNVAELFLSSFISTASYGYLTLAVSVQSLPVSLFGLSLAKAALPALSAVTDDLRVFRKTLISTLYQIMFLVTPISVFLIVLRVPIVRILFGTNIFDWSSTVQTGLILSAFAIGIPAQASIALLARSFYALHETKIPVIVSLSSTALTVFLDFMFILVWGFPTWALALAFSIGSIVEALVLYFIVSTRVNGKSLYHILPIVRSIILSIFSGTVMFFILKFFDRSVWVKRLSFLSSIDAARNLNFENFVLDTRYTPNLIILTVITTLVGVIIYLLMSYLFKSQELAQILSIIKRRNLKAPVEETETLSPVQDSSTGNI